MDDLLLQLPSHSPEASQTSAEEEHGGGFGNSSGIRNIAVTDSSGLKGHVLIGADLFATIEGENPCLSIRILILRPVREGAREGGKVRKRSGVC